MKEETGYFSSLDGLKLFYRAWNKSSDVCLIIVHGIGEHSGRYQDFAALMQDSPISIFCMDLRGHGRSEGPRVFVNSFREYISDLEVFQAFIANHYRKTKFILIGQSLGGLISTSTVLNNQSLWSALILMSPFFQVFGAHQMLSFLAIILNSVVPKLVWHNPVMPAHLSHDQEEVNKYKNDPMIQRCITARLAREMFRDCAFVYNHASEIRLPVLILASGDDRVVCLKATKNFYKRISSQDKQLKVFEGSYHELLHERERAEAVHLIKNFLVNYLLINY